MSPWRRPPGSALRVAAMLGCTVPLVLGACGSGAEYAVLIEAFSSSPDALLEGTEVVLRVQELETGAWATSPAAELGAQDVVDDSFRAAVTLEAPAQILVRLEVRGRGGVHVATRCYTVTGVVHSKVALSGPIDAEADPDGDGWASPETCLPRTNDGAGCEARCPAPTGVDCQPDDPDVYPGAPDPCGDGIDQDCDGADSPCLDGDQDGAPKCPEGVVVDCDCDDTNPDVGPGIEETPGSDLCENGRDDDCDGADALCDRDGDGAARCPDDVVGNPTCDCDDSDPSVHPGATETPDGLCDEIDNNCNGAIDEDDTCLGDDLDHDGSPADCGGEPGCVEDCNDCNAGMAPSGVEHCGDRIDGDCTHDGTDDGQLLPPDADECDPDDADGDGVRSVAAGGTDCDDANDHRFPGAPDQCGDGVDQDCSGGDTSCDDDADGDGYAASEDCDDANPDRAPWLPDTCNGIDDDCDGVVDEDLPEGFGCVVGAANGPLIDFASELVHCGGCRHSCNAGCGGALCIADTCAAGVCLCADDGRACNGDAADFCCPRVGCRDLQGDADNCGQCGTRCSAPECLLPVCRNGSCATDPAPDGTACSANRVCCGGDCTGECAPDAQETRACGDCGTQTRSCNAGCHWGDWSACSGEGECSAGAVETQTCGNCGSQSRSCSDQCVWSNWGACGGEGACAPAAVRQQPCNECGNQEQRCSAACQWEDFGNCDNNPARSCADGNFCTIDSCSGSGNCNHTPTECCGSDVSGCGSEPTCRDWWCDNGTCRTRNTQRNTDPENECTGQKCCNGNGGCSNTEQNC